MRRSESAKRKWLILGHLRFFHALGGPGRAAQIPGYYAGFYLGPPRVEQGVLCLRVIKVHSIVEECVDPAVCQRALDRRSWSGNLVLPKFADAKIGRSPPSLSDPPSRAPDLLASVLSKRVSHKSCFTQPQPTVEAAQGREQLRRSMLRVSCFFPHSRGRSLR